MECQHTWKPAGIKYKGTELNVIHGRAQIRLLGIRYNMWLDSTAQRRYVMDRITDMACFLRKNRDLSIENSLRLIECTLDPLLAFSGPVIIWLEKEFKRLTAAFVRCNKEAWQMSPNTSTALFNFPKDQGGLQIKMPRAITKLTKDDQQPVLLLPARWCPDTLPVFDMEDCGKGHTRE